MVMGVALGRRRINVKKYIIKRIILFFILGRYHTLVLIRKDVNTFIAPFFKTFYLIAPIIHTNAIDD